MRSIGQLSQKCIPALVILLLLLTFTLAACGGRTGATSTSTQNSSQSSSTGQQSTTPAADATKIQDVDQHVQQSLNSLDASQNDATTSSKAGSDTDQNP